MNKQIATLFAILSTFHIYDFTLHAEDLLSITVPWQAPHHQSAGLQALSYTEFWALYWGLAAILSLYGFYLSWNQW